MAIDNSKPVNYRTPGSGMFNRTLQEELLAEFRNSPGGAKLIEEALNEILSKLADNDIELSRASVDAIARQYAYDVDMTLECIAKRTEAGK